MQKVNPDLQPYLKELEDLQSIDKLIASMDKFDPEKVTCSIDDKEVDCETWEEKTK